MSSPGPWNQPSWQRPPQPQWTPPQQAAYNPRQATQQQVGQPSAHAWPPQQQPWPQPQQPWTHVQQPWPPPVQPRRRGSFARTLLLVGLGLIFLIVASTLIANVLAGDTAQGQSQQGQQSAPQYQNESYQVPAADRNPPVLPQPKTMAQADQWLKANTLYAQSVANPVRCDMGDIDPARASKAQLQAHLNEMMGCLLRVWGPTIEAAGWTATRPTVTVYSTPVKTKCGDMSMSNAAYCAGDQQVYVASDVLDIIPRSLASSRFQIETILAHEFGHAIQARTGILVSEIILEQRSDTKAQERELSRRLEVQADCFAGMFASSVRQSLQLSTQDLGNVVKLTFAIGDDQLSGKPGIEGDHGHGSSRQYWMKQGLSGSQVGACNSFTANESLVR